MAMAWTVLLHAAMHWSEAANSFPWSMVVKGASRPHNRIPTLSTGLFSIDLWSKSCLPTQKLHNLHVWGSPVHAPQKQLAGCKSIGW